jgi:chromosome segregation ATPase
MKLKEIESKKTEIEKEVLKTEQQLDTLVVEIATLEAQIKSKNRKVMDLTEQISSKRSELRKLEIAKEIMQTPAQLDNTGEAEEEPKKYDGFKGGFDYKKGDRFKVEKRLYEVVYDHTSDEKFNKLLTNKYQLIDEDTLKPINDWSFTKTYNKFDKVLYQDNIYSSKIDNNTTSPRNNPENWFKID